MLASPCSAEGGKAATGDVSDAFANIFQVAEPVRQAFGCAAHGQQDEHGYDLAENGSYGGTGDTHIKAEDQKRIKKDI